MAVTSWKELSGDMLYLCLDYLNNENITKCTGVCRNWQKIVDSDGFQKNLFRKSNPLKYKIFINLNITKINWKQLVQSLNSQEYLDALNKEIIVCTKQQATITEVHNVTIELIFKSWCIYHNLSTMLFFLTGRL